MALQARTNTNLDSNRKHSWKMASPTEFSIQNKQKGRAVIPKLAIAPFKDGKPYLDGYVVEVGLTPL
jgi:hypothetical protein